MADNLDLSLKIEALVKGVAEVKALGAELRGLVNQARQRAPDPTAGIGKGSQGASAGVLALTGALRAMVVQASAAAAAVLGLAAASRNLQAFERDFSRLEAVARFAGVGVRDALLVAQSAAADGLLPLNDAIRATSDLLERGFSLPEAGEMLRRFKDEAATAATSSAELGQKVVAAAQGGRDAGDAYAVYAASVGKTVEQLTDAERRQAEYLEVLRRTEPFLGAAARASDSLRGDQDRLKQSVTEVSTVIGGQLEPALRVTVRVLRSIVDGLRPVLFGFEAFGAILGFVAVTAGKVFDQIRSKGLRALKDIGPALKRDLQTLDQQLEDIARRVSGGLTPDADAPAGAVGPDRRTDRGGRTRGRDTAAARLAEVRAAAQAELNLVQENLRQAEAAYRRALDENLLSFRDYYRAKTAIEEQGIDAEIAARRDQLAAERRAAATGREEAERIQALARVAELEGEIGVLNARRGEVARANAAAQRAAEKSLADELARVDRELKEIAGTLSGADLRAELSRQFEPLLAELANRGDEAGRARVVQLIDAKAEVQEFRRLDAEVNAILGRLANQETTLNARREAGLITETQARQDLVALYQRTGAEIERLIPAMESLGIAASNPEVANQVGRVKARVEELKVAVDEVALRLNGDVRDAATDAFASMATGAKSAKDAGLDFVHSLRDSLARLASERLVEAVFGPLLRGGGGIGGLFSGLLSGFGLHAGGIVGAGHTFTRRVSPLAFAGAPRYHLGGIAGDEVPAILRRGEEVLTEDDPRHRRNFAPGTTVVNVIENPARGGDVERREQPGLNVVDVFVAQVERRLGARIAKGQGDVDQAIRNSYNVSRVVR